MRDKLLDALREAARLHAPRLPSVAEVALLAGVDEADVTAQLGPAANFSALLSYQSPAHETRDRIIASAARVFAQKGVQRASLDEIAGGAGLTKGAIYWHFKNKNDLFFAMLDSRLRQDTAPLLGDLDNLIHAGGDPLDGLTAMFQTSLRRCVDDPDWPRLFLECLNLGRDPDVRERLAAFYDDVWAVSRGFTTHLQANGLTDTSIDPHVAAVFWTALFDGLVVAWQVKGEALDLDRLLPALFRMLWQGLAPALTPHNDKTSSGEAP